jgi:hypothetical protein
MVDADEPCRRVLAHFFPRERPTVFDHRTARFRKDRLTMVRARRFTQFSAVAMAASILLFAAAAFAGGPPNAAKGSSEIQTINASDRAFSHPSKISGTTHHR